MNYYKTALIIFLLFATSFTAMAGTNKLFEISSLKFGVRITEDEKNIVLIFNDNIDRKQHSIIDIMRINDLEYKTRLMRYFGGLLKTKTYQFEKLIIIDGNNTVELEFSRDNISLVINQVCRYAEELMPLQASASNSELQH